MQRRVTRGGSKKQEIKARQDAAASRREYDSI